MAYDIAKIRADFPLLGRKVYGRELAYLDNGATAQKPLQVIEKIDYLHRELNANVHRGLHYLSEECTSEYEAAREQVRALIGAASVREIVFTAGATAAINTVAYSFGEKYIHAGDNVITTEMEHHANIVPWQLICERKGAELRVVPFDDAGRLMTEKLPELLDERTRIVCITQASNVLGTRPDLSPVIDLSHRAGVPVLVDGCQGIVHGGVDVQALDCDFYAFSGHKLYGPTGIGVLYGKEKWLEQMPPFMGGETWSVRSVFRVLHTPNCRSSSRRGLLTISVRSASAKRSVTSVRWMPTKWRATNTNCWFMRPSGCNGSTGCAFTAPSPISAVSFRLRSRGRILTISG